MRTRIIIVGDHAIVRSGMTELIKRIPGLEVVGEAASGSEALRLVARVQADVALVDISMEVGFNGIELVKSLRSQFPALIVLVLSMHDEELYGERALLAGASGYISKRAPLERIIEALERVAGGRVYASAELLERMAALHQSRPGVPTTRLSDRELEVLELIGRGLGTREIAEQLRLSVKTIETYRGHLKTKLDIESAPQLVRYAVRWVDDLGAKAS